jgi:hypothetical protein
MCILSASPEVVPPDELVLYQLARCVPCRLRPRTLPSLPRPLARCPPPRKPLSFLTCSMGPHLGCRRSFISARPFGRYPARPSGRPPQSLLAPSCWYRCHQACTSWCHLGHPAYLGCPAGSSLCPRHPCRSRLLDTSAIDLLMHRRKPAFLTYWQPPWMLPSRRSCCLPPGSAPSLLPCQRPPRTAKSLFPSWLPTLM